jgi:hypothetical protein
MRVLCVDNKVRSNSMNPEILQLIKEGEPYEVYDTSLDRGVDGSIGTVYYLVGINERPYGINSDRFVPLSDIDENELVNTKEDSYA